MGPQCKRLGCLRLISHLHNVGFRQGPAKTQGPPLNGSFDADDRIIQLDGEPDRWENTDIFQIFLHELGHAHTLDKEDLHRMNVESFLLSIFGGYGPCRKAIEIYAWMWAIEQANHAGLQINVIHLRLSLQSYGISDADEDVLLSMIKER